jgi:hypothetical protein
MAKIMLQPLHLWKKTLVPTELEADVPWSQYGCFKEKNFLPLPGIEPQITSGLVATPTMLSQLQADQGKK